MANLPGRITRSPRVYSQAPQPGTCNRPKGPPARSEAAAGRVRVPDDHPPPHFHAIYGEFDAQIAIDTLEILRGHLPRRVQVLVIEWAMAHRLELRENWRRAERHDSLLQIVPLDKEA